MSLPDTPLGPEELPGLADRFFDLYEKTYGRGTAWKGVGVQLLNLTVTATGRRERHDLPTAAADPQIPDSIRRETRRVFLPSERRYRELPIYDDARFCVGTSVAGPAIIDAADTTIFVPPGTRARRDEFKNYVLSAASPVDPAPGDNG